MSQHSGVNFSLNDLGCNTRNIVLVDLLLGYPFWCGYERRQDNPWNFFSCLGQGKSLTRDTVANTLHCAIFQTMLCMQRMYVVFCTHGEHAYKQQQHENKICVISWIFHSHTTFHLAWSWNLRWIKPLSALLSPRLRILCRVDRTQEQCECLLFSVHLRWPCSVLVYKLAQMQTLLRLLSLFCYGKNIFHLFKI